MAPLMADSANGIIAVSYPQTNTLVIVDTNSKKMLLYAVSEGKGLSLKEVRSFENVLEAPNFFAPRGLNGRDEKKELPKLMK